MKNCWLPTKNQNGPKYNITNRIRVIRRREKIVEQICLSIDSSLDNFPPFELLMKPRTNLISARFGGLFAPCALLKLIDENGRMEGHIN